MITYGHCPHCGRPIKADVVFAQVNRDSSAAARVKPGSSAAAQAAAAPPPVPLRPAGPAPAPGRSGANGQGDHLCPECGEPGMYLEGVARKNGRPYKAFKCITAGCPAAGQLVPGTFRWLAVPV